MEMYESVDASIPTERKNPVFDLRKISDKLNDLKHQYHSNDSSSEIEDEIDGIKHLSPLQNKERYSMSPNQSRFDIDLPSNQNSFMRKTS